MDDRGKSGGERARSPNASRGAEMPGGRASVWIAVALAPLSGRPASRISHWQRADWSRRNQMEAEGNSFPEIILGWTHRLAAVRAV